MLILKYQTYVITFVNFCHVVTFVTFERSLNEVATENEDCHDCNCHFTCQLNTTKALYIYCTKPDYF